MTGVGDALAATAAEGNAAEGSTAAGGSTAGADTAARADTAAGDTVAGDERPGAARMALAAALAALGEPLGEVATLVQFSAVFCAPCRRARGVLTEVAGLVPGVRHVEVDAESQLDLVRRLRIERTPTVLVLDGAGAEVRRAAGAPPSRDAVLATLAAIVSGGQGAGGGRVSVDL